MDTPISETKNQSESDQTNALQENIQKNGDLSYYYAHAPRNSGEEEFKEGIKTEGPGLVTGGTPIMLSSTKSGSKPSASKSYTTLSKYMWLDAKKKIKIYIDLTDPIFKKEESKDIEPEFEVDL